MTRLPATWMKIGRRKMLGATAALAGSSLLPACATRRPATSAAAGPTPPPSRFLEIVRLPARVHLLTSGVAEPLDRGSAGHWTRGDVEVETVMEGEVLRISVAAPRTALERIVLRWDVRVEGELVVLGDHWERSYADLAWKAIDPARVLPWYFLTFDGKETHGYGVRTNPGALAHFELDREGVTLVADVRSGGTGVRLGDRRVVVAEVSARRGAGEESAFVAARAFCRQLCPRPRLASAPVYGINDWYYAYGKNTAQGILRDAQYHGALAPAGANRPFCVIDDGWQVGASGDQSQWERGNEKFPSLPDLAAQIRTAGMRPGIWYRPLAPLERDPIGLRTKRDGRHLDPTVAAVLERVRADMARLRGWGYELIKHDYSTADITGKWGRQMGRDVTRNGWAFADSRFTTAEVMTGLYRAIREAAGDALVIGCNTMSHLSAGVFELQRIGDDTSGREWTRTVRYGVNTLAFRGPQHDAFYAADADCVPITRAIPWDKTRRWLDLVSRSGTPLFVSAEAGAMGAEQEKALREAYAIAARPQPLGDPLDWMKTPVPQRWRLMGKTVDFQW
jgi:alpha-galactosidase